MRSTNMSPRSYRMARRAESAAGTRRRIVEATYDLHKQKGVGATTFRDIATLADVGIGTVYHHFPTYDDVIAACGEHTFSLARPPHNAIFEGLENVEDRVRILVREVFSFYRRLPTLGRIRSERFQFAALDRGFMHEEHNRRELVKNALRGARASVRLQALAFALLDFGVYQNLCDSGLDHDSAVDEITNSLTARLSAGKRSTRR